MLMAPNSRLSNIDIVPSDILKKTIETSLSEHLNLSINAIFSQKLIKYYLISLC